MSLAILLSLLAVAALGLLAQSPSGQIIGRVLDATQAAVPEPTVHAIALKTNTVTRTVSNAEGNFELRNLVPGLYRREAEKHGFNRFVCTAIESRVGDVLNLDIPLEVGAPSETVTVTAEAPLLESATASVGRVIDNRRIPDMPAPGSSVVYLIQMAPGTVVTTSPPGSGRRTTLVPSLDDGLTFRATLADPFPDGIFEPLDDAQNRRPRQCVSGYDKRGGYRDREDGP